MRTTLPHEERYGMLRSPIQVTQMPSGSLGERKREWKRVHVIRSAFPRRDGRSALDDTDCVRKANATRYAYSTGFLRICALIVLRGRCFAIFPVEPRRHASPPFVTHESRRIRITNGVCVARGPPLLPQLCTQAHSFERTVDALQYLQLKSQYPYSGRKRQRFAFTTKADRGTWLVTWQSSRLEVADRSLGCSERVLTACGVACRMPCATS